MVGVCYGWREMWHVTYRAVSFTLLSRSLGIMGPLEFSWVTEGRRRTSPRRCLTGLSLLRHLWLSSSPAGALVSSTLGAASLVAVVPTCKARVPCQPPGGGPGLPLLLSPQSVAVAGHGPAVKGMGKCLPFAW